MYSDLLVLIRVKDEADALVQEIEELEAALFKTEGGEWDRVMASKVRLRIAEVLKSQLPQGLEDRRKALRELKEEVSKLPVVKLTLAIEPTEKMVQEISDILRKTVSAGIIVDIQRDSMIVAGALVTCDGKFGDFSVATKMEKVWAVNAEKLTKMAYGGN